MRREFKLDEDLTEPMDNYGSFKEHLERLQYAGRLATQDTAATDSPLTTPDKSPRRATKPKRATATRTPPPEATPQDH